MEIEIVGMRDEWRRLVATYEGVLVDLHNQIEMNITLKNSLLDLESKIEVFNSQIGGFDLALIQQFESISKQTRKSIDFLSKKDLVRRAENEIQSLKAKIGRLESQKLSKSQVFAQSLSYNIEFEFKQLIDQSNTNIVSGGSTVVVSNGPGQVFTKEGFITSTQGTGYVSLDRSIGSNHVITGTQQNVIINTTDYTEQIRSLNASKN